MSSRRRLPIVSALLLAVLICAGPALAVSPPDHPQVSGPVAGADLTSPESLGWTPEQAATARDYSRSGWTLYFVDSLLRIATLILVIFTGFAGRLDTRIRSLVGRYRLLGDAVFVVAIVVVLAALNFPLEVWRFRREHMYGFATQGVVGWLGDEIKVLLIVCVFALLFFLPVWGAIRRWPRAWWVIGSAIGVALAIFAIAVAPVFIAPLFNTFTPLKDEALKGRILAMAHREGIPADNVYEVDASRQSRHDNAYVVGLLGTQRIALYDTLLSAYDPSEIEFVMGHEMGHYVLNHVWKGIAFAAGVIVLGFFLVNRIVNRIVAQCAGRIGYDNAGSIAAVPLLILVFTTYMFLIDPLQNAFSRGLEHQADIFGVKAIGGDDAAHATAVTAFQRMAARNLSEPNPPAFIEWWMYSHPSMGNRIRFAAGR